MEKPPLVCDQRRVVFQSKFSAIYRPGPPLDRVMVVIMVVGIDVQAYGWRERFLRGCDAEDRTSHGHCIGLLVPHITYCQHLRI